MKLLDINPTQATWAGIPWAAASMADENAEFKALVNHKHLLYNGHRTNSGFIILSTAKANEFTYYNEVAKNQILTALRTLYSTL